MFKFYFTKVLKQDLLTKYFYKNFLELPRIDKVILNFTISQISLKSLLPFLGGLHLISNQKPFLLCSKKTILHLRIRRGFPIGCKVNLRGDSSFIFLEKLCFLILPKCKEFIGFDLKKKTFFIRINNVFAFTDIEKEYSYFSDLSSLNISIFFKANSKLDVVSILKGLKFPFNV